MKRVFIWVTLLVTMIVQSNAQDVIVKRDGSTIISKVLEVNTGDIKYKKFSNQTGPTYTIDKVEVMTINYENGEKDVFDVANTVNQVPSQAQNASVSQGGGMSEASKAANNAYISSVNNFLPAWAEPQKAKKANGTFNVLKIDENSVLENDDIKMQLVVWTIDKDKSKGLVFSQEYELFGRHTSYGLLIKIQNKTNKVIYIDKGNTFITRNEEAEPYYIPTATSTTHGSSSGVGVNMGAVAGAMGLGGTIGQLASGVNVGGGSSNSTQVIEYSQRVVAIPPKSSKGLDVKVVMTESMNKELNHIVVADESDNKLWFYKITSFFNGLMVGDIVHWTQDTTPLKLQLHISYDFDEQCTNLVGLQSMLYLSETFGIKGNGFTMSGPDVEQLNGWQNTPFYFFMLNKPDDGVALSPLLNIEHTGK